MSAVLPIVEQLRALVERKGQLRAEIGLRAIELRAINDALAEARDLLIATAPAVRVSPPSAAAVGIIRPAIDSPALTAPAPERDNPPTPTPERPPDGQPGQPNRAPAAGTPDRAQYAEDRAPHHHRVDPAVGRQSAQPDGRAGVDRDDRSGPGPATHVAAPLRAHDVEPDSRRRTEILTFLQTGPQPTRAIAKHLKIDRIVCKMALQRMRKVGLLVTVGEKNGQRWTLPIVIEVPAVERPAVVVPIAPRSSPAPSIAAVTAKLDAAVVTRRDAELLRLLNVNNGVITLHELRRRFPPQSDPATDAAAKEEALKNTLLRLKARGLIARTADTWSLVGAGSLPAHG